MALLVIGTNSVFITFSTLNILNKPKESTTRQTTIIDLANNQNTPEYIDKVENSVGLPLRLEIPSLGLKSSFEYVGLMSDGEMGVPSKQENVAWLNLGYRPGENGSAIVAGHYGWKDSKPSAFDNLYKLRKGDKIHITDDKGNVFVFKVRQSKRYGAGVKALEVFSASDGKPHLNLVSCEGVWNKDSNSYSKRLVVFADLDI